MQIWVGGGGGGGTGCIMVYVKKVNNVRMHVDACVSDDI